MIRRYKRKFSSAAAVIAVFVCAGIFIYAKDKIGGSVSVSAPVRSSPVIVIDAGHGGIDGGCSTADGVTEKGINLNILLSVRDTARFFGYETDTTRTRDTSIHDKGVTGIRSQKISDMENRLEIFNKHSGAVCVSIHQNTFSDPKYMGAQMFYSDKNPESERLASIMQSRFADTLQPYNDREIKLCGKELYLCYFCDNPAVMIECGFLSNPEEAVKLSDKGYQQKVAFTIFSGLNEFITT